MNKPLPLPYPVELYSERIGTLNALMRAIAPEGMLVDIEQAELPLNARVMLRIDINRVRYRVPALVVHHSAAGVGLMYADLDAVASAALYNALQRATRAEKTGTVWPYWLQARGVPAPQACKK